METEKITLVSRILIGFFNGVVGFILILLVQTVFFFKGAHRGGSETGMLFVSSPVLWYGSVIFFVLGFILGPTKMANLWGKIFGTNKN
jgi:hypothetical protein